MMKRFKYSLGVDVSKDSLDCCLCIIEENGQIKIIATRKFGNKLSGFKAILNWIKKHSKNNENIPVTMEATGIYHENFAHFVYDNSNFKISIILPNKAKYYFKSLNIKTKTDKVDSIMLSRYGLERQSENWEPLSKHIRTIKQLSREYRDLKKQITALKNKLHARKHAYCTDTVVIKFIKQQIKLLEKQCTLLEVELNELVYEDPFLSEKIEKICTIPGIGFMTLITIIAETNGFELIKNGKQLCSYAGMDVQQNSSGKKSGKSRLSKKGNKYIRQAVYMPALNSSRRIKSYKQFYERINQKHECKKVGLLAVSRKLLVLTYTLWKKDEVFDPNYNFFTSGYQEEEVLLRQSNCKFDTLIEKKKVGDKLITTYTE